MAHVRPYCEGEGFRPYLIGCYERETGSLLHFLDRNVLRRWLY